MFMVILFVTEIEFTLPAMLTLLAVCAVPVKLIASTSACASTKKLTEVFALMLKLLADRKLTGSDLTKMASLLVVFLSLFRKEKRKLSKLLDLRMVTLYAYQLAI